MIVSDRSPFLRVLYLSTFLSIPERFMTVSERFRSFYERFRSLVTFLRDSTGSGGITAGQFGAMPHLKLENFYPIFSRV
jgi:hypothetical protein